MKCRLTHITNVGLILILGFSACEKQVEKAADTKSDVLVSVGDSSLRVADVSRYIPSGLSEVDSVEMFNSIRDRWVRNMMLKHVASENLIDEEKIDRMVEDYRNSLIIDQYLKRMNENIGDISQDKIDQYYQAHKEDMILTSPLVKGVYIKVAESESRISDLKRWMKSASESSIDKIERYGLKQASQYEYFKDRWVEWSDVVAEIPYRFANADDFLKRTKNFETTHDGSIYLLHISQYMPTGSVMPRDYANNVIRDILTREESNNYKQRLMESIYKQGIESGVLKPGIYNPIKR